MSQPTIARIGLLPMEFDIRILVERVVREQGSVSGKPQMSNYLVATTGEPMSREFVTPKPIRLLANGVEILEPKTDAQQDDKSTVEQELAAIGPRLVDDVCVSDFESIRIDFEQSQQTQMRRDFILPIRDWLCISSIVLVEAVVFFFMLGSH